jgi:hypothetical protein
MSSYVTLASQPSYIQAREHFLNGIYYNPGWQHSRGGCSLAWRFLLESIWPVGWKADLGHNLTPQRVLGISQGRYLLWQVIK